MRKRGHYPINHPVVIRDDLIAAHPGLAADVFDAFAAIQAALSRPPQKWADREADLSGRDEIHKKVMAITGDPLPYGIEPNRESWKALVGHALTQRIITRPFDVEELFAPGTARSRRNPAGLVL